MASLQTRRDLAAGVLAWATGVCLCLAGCGQGDRPSTAAATRGGPAGVAAPPTIVKTKSGADMVLIPGGTFQMGRAQGERAEGPVHGVYVSAFLMDRCEVTQEQYAQLQLPDPSHFKNARNPVDQANWTDAARFCNERSRAEGLKPCYDETTWACDVAADGYRLPTEAEWEYACRAGADTRYSFGDDARALGLYAWFDGNAGGTTHPVAQKQPNRWGLYDMHGNVAEWCNDLFDAAYYQTSPERDPRGPSSGGPDKAVRGGSWKAGADACRATARSGDRSVLDTCLASDTLGFRCVRKAPDSVQDAVRAGSK
jgi:formylglycine-generating enzyme required for sulfatase activity